MANENEDRVAAAFACPQCGEDRVDHLAWLDETTVRCTACAVEYQPDADAPPGDGVLDHHA